MQTLSFPAGETVAGMRQVLRALKQNRAERVYLAENAAPKLRQQVLSAAQAADVAVEEAGDMAALGRLCRIAVPCAAAARLKP